MSRLSLQSISRPPRGACCSELVTSRTRSVKGKERYIVVWQPVGGMDAEIEPYPKHGRVPEQNSEDHDAASQRVAHKDRKAREHSQLQRYEVERHAIHGRRGETDQRHAGKGEQR